MNYDFIKSIIPSIIPSIIAGLITYQIANKNIFSTIRLKVANDQLKIVYLPLFTFLEPYLYKKCDIRIIEEFIKIFTDIKSNNYELIDSNLLNSIQILEKSINNNSYNFEIYMSVCSTLDKLFERTRRSLKLPTRNILYRLNNKQYGSTINEIIIFIKDIVLSTMPLILLMLIFLIIQLLFSSFIQLIK